MYYFGSVSYQRARVLDTPMNEEEENVAIQFLESNENAQIDPIHVKDSDPNPTMAPSDTPSAHPFPLCPWISPNSSKAPYAKTQTRMPLLIFRRDRAIPLAKFENLAQSLVTNQKLFKGWKNSTSVIPAEI